MLFVSGSKTNCALIGTHFFPAVRSLKEDKASNERKELFLLKIYFAVNKLNFIWSTNLNLQKVREMPVLKMCVKLRKK